MAVCLYEHNEQAYNSAVQMLKNSSKAAIIHLTDTGKSFIGFKLCRISPKKPSAGFRHSKEYYGLYGNLYAQLRTGINWEIGLLTGCSYTTQTASKESCMRIKSSA